MCPSDEATPSVGQRVIVDQLNVEVHDETVRFRLPELDQEPKSFTVTSEDLCTIAQEIKDYDKGLCQHPMPLLTKPQCEYWSQVLVEVYDISVEKAEVYGALMRHG